MRTGRLLICALLLVPLMGVQGDPFGTSAGRCVVVRPWLGAAPLRLDGPAVRTPAGDDVRVSAFRFYITDLTLSLADGTTYREPAAYHLIDAEDSASWALALPGAPAGPVAAVSFTVGVDSATNTAGALGGPLDPVHGMYWAWQSGYVNAKIEGISPSRPLEQRRSFSFHVGGYSRPYATRRTVTLSAPAPATTSTLTILADAARWLGAAPLATTPDVLVPGPAAASQADRVAAMFRWITAETSTITTADAPH